MGTTWTISTKERKRLKVFEMRCYERILNIRLMDRTTNYEVLERITNRKLL